MSALEIVFLVSIIALLLGVGVYFLNKWAGKRSAQQQEMVQQHKQTMSIYVIDKKKDKLTNANFPKAMADQIPRLGRIMKMPLVKAKIGPQIHTLIADKKVFDALPLKKTVKVELAGMYIVSMAGMKSKEQLKAQRSSNTGELPLHKKLLSKIGF